MKLSGWGRFPIIEAEGCTFETRQGLYRCLQRHGDCIPHGLGRSYGDSALNARAILTRRFDKLLGFDAVRGIVTCEAGVSLADLIEVFLPRGWFLGITPGTKWVTVGGAIAADVHGKNHHRTGCFSSCVESVRIMLPDGEILKCSREENRELFLATCGGMGLTGVILSARIRLKRVESAYVRRRVIPVGCLEELFELFERHADCSYSVAWLECLPAAGNVGRSLLFLGEHASDHIFTAPAQKRYSVPFECPGVMLNRFNLSLFNSLYYHIGSNRQAEKRIAVESFFYPLDALQNWNRLYGAAGFIQYQFVVPKENSYRAVLEILERIKRRGLGSGLAVLKLLGAENENYLSFPMEGYTLAMDFKIQAGLLPMLDDLDKIVLKHGGRIYLAKDARLTPETFRHGYPRYPAFRKIRKAYGLEGKFQSLQSMRLRV